MISCTIDEMEGRDVVTSEIPGDFLKTSYEKRDIHINMETEMVNLLEEIDLDYYKDFIYIDICEKNARIQNPRRLYTSL